MPNERQHTGPERTPAGTRRVVAKTPLQAASPPKPQARTRGRPHLATGPRRPVSALRLHADLGIAVGLLVVAAAARGLPPGALRTALVLPILLVAPGYLLVQALRPRGEPRSMQDLLLALGLSLPVLGLAALLTSTVPGGFTATSIVVVTTLACIGLAAIAAIRRRKHATAPQETAAASAA